MTSRAMDAADTLWLRMDRAENQMVIESLMLLDELPEEERLLALLRHRVLDRYPVFHQRPRTSRLPLLAPTWQDDPDFSLDRHVRHVVLPAPGDATALQRHIDEQLARPLPRDRPLWEMHLVDGLDSGAAIYTRLHHALADGVALTQVVLSLTDPTPAHHGPTHEQPAAASMAASRRRSHSAPLRVLAGAGSLASQVPSLVDPVRVAETAVVLRQTAGVAAKLLLTRNPPSALAGRVHPEKRVLWAPPIPLRPVVEAGHRTGTTVNDLLVAALAGAVARYLEDHDGVALDVSTMVPVDLRPSGVPLPAKLGNRFALVLLTLPSGLPTAFARLAETHRRMDAIKRSPEAFVTWAMIRAFGLTGPDLERRLVDFFADKATGVTTNVAGPSSARYLAGRKVTGMLGWAPQSGQQPLGTAIFTYDGSIFVGFKIDPAVVEHPDDLLAAYVDEVSTLCSLGAA
jgi:WS/DGAT/MGAT family acyltransferase